MGLDHFQLWRPWTGLAFLTPETVEYLLLVVYMSAAFALLVFAWRDFQRLLWRRLPFFIGLLIAPFATTGLLVLNFAPPNLLPPNIPVLPAAPFVALLGAWPVLVAAAWLGAGPALLVGMGYGIIRTAMTTSGVADVFYYAFAGYVAGFLLRQDYTGRFPTLARLPIVGGPLAVVVTVPALLLAILAHTAGSGLAGLDYAVRLTWAHLGPLVVEWAVASLTILPMYLLFPRLRPVQAARQSPPYARTLNRRMLLLFVPLILVMIFTLVYAVTARTLSVTTLKVVDEMERSALGASQSVSYFVITGRSLLEGFARDQSLAERDPALLQARLEDHFWTMPFFRQLTLFDLDQSLLAMIYPAPDGDPELTDVERQLLQHVIDTGAPQISPAHTSHRGEVILSFLTPVEDELSHTRSGVLIGRVGLDGTHAMMEPILQGLQGIGALGGVEGEGFLIQNAGDDWQVIAHPDPGMLLTEWHREEGSPSVDLGEDAELAGRVYESRNPRDNTRRWVYDLEVEGYDDWAIVISLPYEVVLAQATRIATPLLLLQILLGGGLVVVIPLVTSWLTRPLKQLAAAAGRIAEGDLDRVVQMPGSDEVAQVGDAFESMRVRLKNRLEDLGLLLRVSQTVSATLELPEGVPAILDGALSATQAQVAHFVLLSGEGLLQMVLARGEPPDGLDALDEALARVAPGLESPLTVENVARARPLADPETLSGPIKSLIALPVRTKERLSAVMWVGYGDVRQFDPSEVDLLSTLAGQAAVLVENTHLFQAAEGGRRRLAAILASTSDAVLVTDQDDRILLVNPAAERAFGVASEQVVGQRMGDTPLSTMLAQVLSGPLSPHEALTEEVPLPDGRTLYANVSNIESADGEQIGRVAVMRDITRFKELDELKSEFVATVSHDLRAPLTFMRGYATMLPMVGQLDEKQREYVEKILRGVSQMSGLIDDLLDLGRIEAGVGLDRKPCHLGAILVEAVDSMRARATAKGLTLRLEPSESGVVVLGDAALLRQVVANLVDNAIKYTPSGGVVTIGLTAHDQQVVIRVADTGIGIAPEDQVRLFEKFYRVKRRDTADIPGTGLGLAIVKSVVERHGGKTWVESELNKGSTFYVSLALGNGGVQT